MRFEVWMKNAYPELFTQLYPQYKKEKAEFMRLYKRDYYRKKYGKKTTPQ